MFQKQKEQVLTLLKIAWDNKNFVNKYLIPYEDYFDITDIFTDFSCERLTGKQDYIDLIENLLSEDENVQIFVEVYGFEEHNKDTWIYAETLIIFSKLTLLEVKHILNKANDIFPSEIGELCDFDEKYFVVNNNGDLQPAINLLNRDCFIYYCWWD